MYNVCSLKPTNVFDVCVPLEVIMSCSVVHAVESIDGPLRLPQLRQVLDLQPLGLQGRGGGRWSIGGDDCRKGEIYGAHA